MNSEINRNSSKLKKNIISSAIYQILVMIVPIITTPYVTRIFNSSQMGDFSLSSTIAGFFVIISNFGLNLYGSREIAKNNDLKNRSNVFFSLWSIQIVFSMMMFIIYNLIFLLVLENNDKTLYFIQSILIIINIFDISWFFIGIEEIKRTILRNTIMKIFTTISILIFVKEGNQIHLYALINVLGMILGNLSMISASRKFIDFRYRKFNVTWSNIKHSFKLLIPQIISSSYGTGEKSILKIASNSQSVGIYDQGQKIINLIFSVLNSSLTALMPRISYHVSRNEKDKVQYYMHKGLDYTKKFSIIVVSGILVVSDDFVSFFYGTGYDNVSIVIKITGLALIFIPSSVFLSSGLLIPLKKDKNYLISIIIIVCTGLLLNLILDFKLNLIGASISYVGSQLLGFVYIIFTLRRYLEVKKMVFNLIYTVILIVVNCFIIGILRNNIVAFNSFFSFMLFGTGSMIISIFLIMLSQNIRLLKYKKS